MEWPSSASPGDAVIVIQDPPSASRFVVHGRHGSPVACASYAEAEALAGTYAEHERGNVWYVERGRLQLVCSFRSGPPDQKTPVLDSYRSAPRLAGTMAVSQMKDGRDMKVRDLMTSDVKTCRSETNLAEVVRDMLEGDCGALPVVSDDGRVAGIITDRDICIAVATRGRPAGRIAVGEVARDHVYTCLPDDDASAALQTMKLHKIRRLPVVDADGHVRGMLSLNDIVTHAGAATPTDVVNTLASICEHRRPVAMTEA